MLAAFTSSLDPVRIVLADSADEVEEAGFGSGFCRTASSISQGFWTSTPFGSKRGGLVTQACRTCVGVVMVAPCGAVSVAHVSDRYINDELRLIQARSVSCAHLPEAAAVLNDTLEESLDKMAKALPERPVQIITVGGRMVDQFENFCNNAYLMLFFHNWTTFIHGFMDSEGVKMLVNMLRSMPPQQTANITGIPRMTSDPVGQLSDGDIMRQIMRHVLSPSPESFGGMSPSEVLMHMAVTQYFKLDDASVLPRIRRVARAMPRVQRILSEVQISDPWVIVQKVEAFSRKVNAFFQSFRTLHGDSSLPLQQSVSSKGMVIGIRKSKKGRTIICIGEEEAFEHLKLCSPKYSFATLKDFNAFRGLLIRV